MADFDILWWGRKFRLRLDGWKKQSDICFLSEMQWVGLLLYLDVIEFFPYCIMELLFNLIVFQCKLIYDGMNNLHNEEFLKGMN